MHLKFPLIKKITHVIHRYFTFYWIDFMVFLLKCFSSSILCKNSCSIMRKIFLCLSKLWIRTKSFKQRNGKLSLIFFEKKKPLGDSFFYIFYKIIRNFYNIFKLAGCTIPKRFFYLILTFFYYKNQLHMLIF